MIKIKREDFNIVYEEYEKGNSFILIKCKDRGYKNDNFLIVDGLGEDHSLCVKRYNISEDSIERGKDVTTPMEEWSYGGYNFYILTPEEASPYVKKIMIKSIEDSNSGGI